MSGAWDLALYPQAGEAGGSFHGLDRPGSSGGVWVAESERSVGEAPRRARGKVRRYCAANALNRFGTLTYRGEGEVDPRRVRGNSTAEQVAEWVERSCVDQGLPVGVTDQATVRGVVVLLWRGGGCPGLETPDRGEAAQVECVASLDGRVDHHVVQDGADDGVLPG